VERPQRAERRAPPRLDTRQATQVEVNARQTEYRFAGYAIGNTLQNAPHHSGGIWTVYEIQHGALRGLSFGGGVQARSYRYVDPSDDVILPGYARVDATGSYVFGPSHNEEKRYRIAVNIQNLTNRLYYVSGNTPLDIFPGSPINAMMEFQVRY
jgi:iron complex outermembrane receptor protein